MSKDYNRRRGSSVSRGYGRKWQAFRRKVILKHFADHGMACLLCGDLMVMGQHRQPNNAEVDHIKAAKPDDPLFYQEGNHRVICKSCHSSKTVREDGGFGHKAKNYSNTIGADGYPIDPNHPFNK